MSERESSALKYYDAKVSDFHRHDTLSRIGMTADEVRRAMAKYSTNSPAGNSGIGRHLPKDLREHLVDAILSRKFSAKQLREKFKVSNSLISRFTQLLNVELPHHSTLKRLDLV
jgi:hypothetical protein